MRCFSFIVVVFLYYYYIENERAFDWLRKQPIEKRKEKKVRRIRRALVFYINTIRSLLVHFDRDLTLDRKLIIKTLETT